MNLILKSNVFSGAVLIGTIFIGMIFAIVFAATTAFAHVTIHPQTAHAGSYEKLVFRVPHGCNGSPTTRLTVSIPEGVVAVKPQVHPGWKIEIKTSKYKKPIELYGHKLIKGVSEVSWMGGPLSDQYMDEFGMSVKLPNAAGKKLTFKVIQKCEKGENDWVDPNASMRHDTGANLRAPVLTLTSMSRSM